jgi:hypothetical protein
MNCSSCLNSKAKRPHGVRPKLGFREFVTELVSAGSRRQTSGIRDPIPHRADDPQGHIGFLQ